MMKKKKGLVLLLIVCLCLALSASSARAGSKQRHRWEGVAIGLSAAILGGALLQHHSQHRCTPAPAYCPPPPPRRAYHHPRSWKMKRVWVPRKVTRIWHEGYWEKRVQPGHWREKRMRVGRNHR